MFPGSCLVVWAGTFNADTVLGAYVNPGHIKDNLSSTICFYVSYLILHSQLRSIYSLLNVSSWNVKGIKSSYLKKESVLK